MILFLLLTITLDTLRYPFAAGVLEFPHDEGAHYADTVTSEWWYINMDLISSDGDSFGVMLTHFRKPAIARIFNISTRDSFYSNVNIFGSLIADTGHTYLVYRNLYGTVVDTNKWTYPETGIPFSYYVKVHDNQIGVSCSLYLRAFDYPFAIDSTGVVLLGDSSNISYYYAIPFLNVNGELTIGCETHTVSGLAWIDRQWGPFYVTPEGGYEWFSTVINQNRNWVGIQIWNLFSGDSVPQSPAFRHLNLFVHSPDTSLQIYTSNFSIERLGYIYDPVSQKYFSRGWRVVWQNGRDLVFYETFPEIENQITTFIRSRFYEGITWISRGFIRIGNAVLINEIERGYGFAELVQKYNQSIIPPEPPDFIGFIHEPTPDSIRAVWHPSVEGTYHVAGYRVYLLDPNNLNTIIGCQTVEDTFIILPADSQIAIMLSAFDSASAVNGSDLAGPFVFTGIQESSPNSYPLETMILPAGVKILIHTPGVWEAQILQPDGRTVDKINGEGETEFKVNLEPGVYFVIFKNNSIRKTSRFVVVR